MQRRDLSRRRRHHREDRHLTETERTVSISRRQALHLDEHRAANAVLERMDDLLIILILTFDGKGIVMVPDALRPATKKVAGSRSGRSDAGLVVMGWLAAAGPRRMTLHVLPGRLLAAWLEHY